MRKCRSTRDGSFKASTLEPVERRIGVAPLGGDVYVLAPIGTTRDDRHDRLVGDGKSAVRLVRPLHRRASAVAFG
jgi:hypothetical protein